MNSIAHVGIIMDGNGRWAEQRGMPRWKGHEAGAQAVRRATEEACRQGIGVLTLFAFSSENWRRPAQEINILFNLFRRYLINEREELVKNSIRLSTLGRRDRLPTMIQDELRETEDATRGGTRLHLRLALDYGSRFEIVEAARQLARKVAQGELNFEHIDELRFAETLNPETIPDPDLIIRTSGELRLSNFLLWQAAYAELYFCPKLWPDFSEADFVQAIADYVSRSRRFGALHRATGTIG